MFQFPPQSIPEKINPAIFSRLAHAMPALVHEAGRSGAESMQPLVITIEKAFVPGGNRDCLCAALHLLNGDLDRCHTLCQNVPTTFGAAWHAAMHRQEGDFWNSKYWWRRAGMLQWDRLKDIPPRIITGAPASLRKKIGSLADRYDPSQFVDLVEAHERDLPAFPVLLDLQRWEWASLFIETCDAAAKPL